jgi:hypothetical protein
LFLSALDAVVFQPALGGNMKRIFTASAKLIAFLAAGCVLQAAEPATAKQDKEEISNTILKLMDNLSRTAETLDAGKTLAPLSNDKDAVFFFDSKPYNRAELAHRLGKIYGNVKNMSIKMDRQAVKVLGPDAAVWIASGKGKSVGKDGESYEEFLTETWIWQRMEGKWQVVHYHESVSALPSEKERAKIESALKQFASELQEDGTAPDKIYQAIENFLTKNTGVLGSAFATNPGLGTKSSCYSFRKEAGEAGFERKSTPTSYDYAAAEWYAKAAKSGKCEWSEPYYDIDGAGIFMVTCSVPVYDKDKKLLGVITADLEM